MRSKSSSSSLVNTPLPTPPSDEIVGPFSDVLAATKTFFGDPSSDRHYSMAESRDLSTRPDVPDFFLPYFGATDGREGRISGETPKTRRSQDSKGKMTMTQSPKIETKAGSHPRLSLLSHAAGKMLFGHRLSDAIAKTPSITNFWSRRNSVPSSSGPLPTNTRHKTRARSNAFSITPHRSPEAIPKSGYSELRTPLASQRKHPLVSTVPEFVHSMATVAEFHPSSLWPSSDEDPSRGKKSSTDVPHIPQLSFSPSSGSKPCVSNSTSMQQSLVPPPFSKAITSISSHPRSPSSRISLKGRGSSRYGVVANLSRTLTRPFVLPPLSFESFAAQDVIHYVLASALVHKYSGSERKYTGAPNHHTALSLSRRRSNWATRSSKVRRTTRIRNPLWKTDKPLPALPLH